MTEDELAYGQKTKSFEAWKDDATTMMPWPSDGDIMELIETMRPDAYAEERIIILQNLLSAHYAASRMGVFNDE